MRESVKKFSDKISGEDDYIKESSVSVAIKKSRPDSSKCDFTVSGSNSDLRDTTMSDGVRENASDDFVFSVIIHYIAKL